MTEIAGTTLGGSWLKTVTAISRIGPSASSGPAATAAPRNQPLLSVSVTTSVSTGPGLTPATKPMPAPSRRNVSIATDPLRRRRGGGGHPCERGVVFAKVLEGQKQVRRQRRPGPPLAIVALVRFADAG